MTPHITWHSACMVAIIFYATLKLSQSQNCATEKIENATIDLNVALSRGVRGTDPVHVASWEACVNLCCFGRSISGNKKCNLVIFKPQRRRSAPNCYLFHCPTEEACPVKPAVGLVTYRTIKDAKAPRPTVSLNQSRDLIVNGSLATLRSVVFNTSGPSTPPNWLSPSQKALTPKMTKTLLSQVEKPIDKIQPRFHHPEGEVTNLSHSDSLPTNQTIHSVSPTNTPQNLVHKIVSTVMLPYVKATTRIIPPTSASSSLPPSNAMSVSTVSLSNVSSTGHATADYGNINVATVSPRTNSSAIQPTATSRGRASNLSPPPSGLSKKVSSTVFHETNLSNGRLSTDSVALYGASSEKHAPSWGNKSILLAALLFGVIFLLLAQVVIVRKLIESLRHKHYSRLDYLINGMYANV